MRRCWPRLAKGLNPHIEAASRDRFFAPDVESFAKLGLNRAACAAAGRLGVSHPSLVQATGIPAVLEASRHSGSGRRDVVVTSETGSGKTLVYALPMVDDLSSRETGGIGPRGMVVLPSQELATQCVGVLESLDATLSPLLVRSGAIPSGKGAWGAHKVVVGTAGALQRMEGSLFSQCRWLVLDEADLLVSSFRSEVEHLLSVVGPQKARERVAKALSSSKRSGGSGLIVNPAVRHVLVAATMEDEGQRNVGKWLQTHFRHATHIRTNGLHRPASGARVQMVVVEGGSSPDQGRLRALRAALQRPGRTLVFCNAATTCEAVADWIESELDEPVCTLHQKLDPQERQYSLTQFLSTEPSENILVATDLAARGLDTATIDHVILLEFPRDLVAFLHRVGRTARAGRSGDVTAIVLPEEVGHAKDILQRAEIGVADTVTARRAARFRSRRKKSQ